jgi:DNA-directed RNA polymerase subunit beta
MAMSVEQKMLPVSRKSYAALPQILDVPNLVQVQLDSFRWFQEEGLKALLQEMSPIRDFTGGRLELRFAEAANNISSLLSIGDITCNTCGKTIKHGDRYCYVDGKLGEGEAGKKRYCVECSLEAGYMRLVKDKKTGAEFPAMFLLKGEEELVSAENKDGNNGLKELYPIYEYRTPRHSEQECRQRDLTYSSPLYVNARLLVKETGEVKEENLFFGDMPLMTAKGTYVTSGAERVVVCQLLRSPGVYFTAKEDPSSGRDLCYTKLIPTRGAWLEFETSNRDVISAKIDGKRRIPATTLLRAIGFSSDEELLSLFADDDNSPLHQYIQTTIEREPSITDKSEALLDIYRKLRPGDPPNLQNAEKLVEGLFFDPARYDLGAVGRYKLNERLKLNIPQETRALTRDDMIAIVRRIIQINNKRVRGDDIDHLGNRRVRTVGELIQNQFHIGLLRLERVIRERMSIIPTEAVTASALVNIRPVVATIREFFGGSQLSQFMDQTNPLAEITHKRRLSAMGPGGLSRERAGFDVRDVHFSHYGRICPIETPEGPNIGLIGSLATYSIVNQYGFIETPYRRVISEMDNTDERLVGRTLSEAVAEDGKTIVRGKTIISHKTAAKLAELSPRKIKVVPFVSDEVNYYSADKEDVFIIAQANARLDENNQFVEERVEARLADGYVHETPDKIQLMDVSPKQIVSVATALIPFLEHDDANRALMGANMQRQAVPLLCAEAPIVATGMEAEAAKHSGQALFAENAGTVTSVTGSQIVIDRDDGGKDVYPLMKFVRTNQGTCINQRAVVNKGDHVEAGWVLADSSAIERGELALGQNVVCAFMSWGGYNYEDAIVISSRLVEKDKFTSIHIEKYEAEARETKLGPEEITRDIPNVGEESLRELDDEGIIRVGAEVSPGDILVGKISPKGETELSAEEKLLRAIFGEKAREVKDTSLRVPHGVWGKVINVKMFYREKGDELSAGVNQWVQVWVAQRRKVSVGDKLAGRHGNKGVVSIIAPVEDMPFLPDGTPVDIILNPIGVPSRMNIGQVLETHLGWAAQLLGFKVLTPVFDGASDQEIEEALAKAWIAQKAGAVTIDPYSEKHAIQFDVAKAWLNERGYDGEGVFSDSNHAGAKEISWRLWLQELGIESHDLSGQELEAVVKRVSSEKNLPSPTLGKAIVRDGRSGEPFDQPVTVGNIYMMKLIHLVEDKVHARSTGPYSLIAQQPLGGKAQFGGQRFGEMEVWTLEAYGAAHNLQEVLTIKSDDVTGRAKTYEAIVKNEDILQPGVPESFKVLVKELQSLALAVEVINDEEADEVSELDSEIPLMEGLGTKVLGEGEVIQDDSLEEEDTDEIEEPEDVLEEPEEEEEDTDEIEEPEEEEEPDEIEEPENILEEPIEEEETDKNARELDTEE